MKNSEIADFIDLLPLAFDEIHWSIGDTSYKEEAFMSLITALKIPQERALKLQSKIFPGHTLIRKILKNEVSKANGVYGYFKDGDLFYKINKK